jgi:hypothetical protein
MLFVLGGIVLVVVVVVAGLALARRGKAGAEDDE